MTSEFDSLHYTRQLEAAGVARNQAEVHAQALSGVLALMAPAQQLRQIHAQLQVEASDMEERLTQRIETVRSELLGKIEVARIALDAKIENVRLELDTKLQKLQVILEARIDRLDADIKLMNWVMGLQTGLMVAILIKLFIP